MIVPLTLQLLSPAGARQRLSVLIFHRVLGEPDPLHTDIPDRAAFGRTLRWLKRWFRVLPLDEAVRRWREGSLPARAAAITFDDGYADNWLHAVPVLREQGLSACFFIATGYLDGGRMWNDSVAEALRVCSDAVLDLGDLGLGRHALPDMPARRRALYALLPQLKHLPPAQRQSLCEEIARRAGKPLPDDLMMRNDQLLAMRDAGMVLGAHTRSHPILATLEREQAREEIEGSKRELEQRLQPVGQPVRLPERRAAEGLPRRTCRADPRRRLRGGVHHRRRRRQPRQRPLPAAALHALGPDRAALWPAHGAQSVVEGAARMKLSFLLRWLPPLLLLAAIWWPEGTHYRIDRAPFQGPLPTAQPALLLQELAEFDLAEAEHGPLSREAAMQAIASGVIEVPALGSGRLPLRGYPADLQSGPPTYQLFMAGLSLERVLLAAWRETGERRWLETALARTLQLAAHEATRRHDQGFLWNDHAVASRPAVLIALWAALQNESDLRERHGAELLSFVLHTGRMLAKPSQFTVRTNHGVMQNIALLQLSAGFAGLPEAAQWRELADQRLRLQLGYYVSPEGVVLEHSAGYHALGTQLIGMAQRLRVLNGLPADERSSTAWWPPRARCSMACCAATTRCRRSAIPMATPPTRCRPAAVRRTDSARPSWRPACRPASSTRSPAGASGGAVRSAPMAAS